MLNDIEEKVENYPQNHAENNNNQPEILISA